METTKIAETADADEPLRISKREFIARVAARSGNLIEVSGDDPLRVMREDKDGAREKVRVVEVVSDDQRKIVGDVYEALFDELLEVVSQGGTVVLTGFGRFYRQAHKGHKVRFGKSAVDDYPVLKFSAAKGVRTAIKQAEEDIETGNEHEDADEEAEEGHEMNRESRQPVTAVAS